MHRKRSGARGRNRTADTMIFSHVLYQLSYPGIAAAKVRPEAIRGPASEWKRAYGEAGRAWQAGFRSNCPKEVQAAIAACRG